MLSKRIQSHPILDIPNPPTIEFYWQDKRLTALSGETIAAALIANGYDIFGHHPKDGSPLGLFCANGQCSQCMVLVDGKPIKSCMTQVQPDMHVSPADGLPDLTKLHGFEAGAPTLSRPQGAASLIEIPVLIIGGGPAGLSAAIELGELGIRTILVDDKVKLGGKLVLQTHRFFGSTGAVYAGTRGIDIAQKLSNQVSSRPAVDIWLETTAIGIFEEKTVGLWRADQEKYVLVKPQTLLVVTGARERSLPFTGNTLPGIYGAGAFQTLVNRDLVKPAQNLFIVGGGNVGLIAGYHALQAGINVVGLVEALPACGGYKVHEDKLARLGVSILTSHTILEARGKDHVKSILIARLDENFKPIPETEQEIACDCVLIAVGLNPVDEFIQKAEEVGLPVFAAGDAAEIAEASAAIFSGKIKGLEIAQSLGVNVPEIPTEWREFEGVLKSKPGNVLLLDEEAPPGEVFPVLHCHQEIPCNPCASVCPNNLIVIDPADIRAVPYFCPTDEKNCIACERCVAICPGLAITLVDNRRDPAHPIISIPLEFSGGEIEVGDLLPVTDVDGVVLGHFPVTHTRTLRQFSGTLIVRVRVDAEIAMQVAGIQWTKPWQAPHEDDDHFPEDTHQENIVCRCEHITAEEIRSLIRNGARDINQIKAATKATMGACAGKTCLTLIKNMFNEEGVPLDEVSDPPKRPVFVEMPLDILANNQQEEL